MPVEVEKILVSMELRKGQYERDLGRASATTRKQMAAVEKRTAKMSSRLNTGFRSAAQSAQLIHGPLSGIASRITTLSGVVGSSNVALAGFAIGIGGATFAAVKALGAFERFETQSLVLEGVLKATGGASGKTAKEIEALAQSIAAATLASTDDIRKAAAQLLTFRSISGDTFEQTLRLAQDMAATLSNTSLPAAVLQLGKALEDPAKNLSALARSGTGFTATQEKLIKSLAATGETAKAQSEILKVVNKQYGGAGVAAASGLAGAYDALGQSTDNLLVSWGKQISEAIDLEQRIKNVADGLDRLNDRTGNTEKPVEEKLKDINRRIAILRELSAQPIDDPSGFGRAIAGQKFQELKTLIKRREALERLLEVEKAHSELAKQRGAIEQREAARQRIKGVLSDLEDELELAGKVAIERKKINELKKAGVEADSAQGQQIIKKVEAINAETKALQEREAAEKRAKAAAKAIEQQINVAQQRTDLTRTQIAVIGEEEVAQKKALLALQFKHAAERIAARGGIELTKEKIAQIESEAAATAEAAAKLSFLRSLQGQRDETDAIRDEVALIGLYGIELHKARVEQELLTAAKRAGIDLTPQLRAQIEAEAERNAAAKAYLETVNDVRETSNDALKGFITDMRDGVSATESLANALNRVSDKLIDMAVNGLVESALGPLLGAGSGAGSSGSILSLFGFADGGKVRGPGTSTSDSIPARLSNGEYVVNAQSARQNAALLEAINSGRVPRFAAGGGVNVPNVSVPNVNIPKIEMPKAVRPSVGTAPTVVVNASFHVENGTPEGVEKMNSETLPKMKQLIRSEVVQLFDTKARFMRSGI